MDARFKPMLCSPADEIPANADEYRLEPKLDGWRTVIAILETGVQIFGGRNGSEYTGKLPYITDDLAAALPVGTVLDGELICPAGWGGVQGAMTRGAGPHIPGPVAPALTFVAFDILLLNTADIRAMSWTDRRAFLEMIEWPEFAAIVPSGEASAEAHVRMLDMGMEGSVIKNVQSTYLSGVRSPHWRKIKAIDSEDCEIVGFKDGENGRSGEVGAIIVKLPSGVETTASGMTDKVRADMLANPGNYVGKIVEITHNGVLASGKLRHPRFKRMRDDRSPAAKPKPKPRAPRASGGRKAMRAYNLMAAPKLETCMRELAFASGDAYERVMAGRYAGSLEDHRRACRDACLAKGLSVPAFNTP